MIRRLRSSDDSGMSLVELIVAGAVSAIVVALLATLLMNGMRGIQEATERDNATTGANVAVATLQTSLRSGASFRVSEGGTRLDAVVALAGADTGDAAWDWSWECHAWKVSGSALYYSEGTTARPTDIVTGQDAIVTGVTPTLSSGIAFAQGTGSIDEQRRVRIGMTFTTGGETVVVSDAVVAQAFVQGGAPACW